MADGSVTKKMSESTPTYKVLVEESRTLVNWGEVGILLGLQKSDIDTIEWECPRDLSGCRLRMLDKWLKNDVNSTWEKYCEALENSSNQVLARKLRQKYTNQCHNPAPFSSSKITGRDSPDNGNAGDCISSQQTTTIEVSRKHLLALKFDEIEITFSKLVEDTEVTLLEEEVSLVRLKRCCKRNYRDFPIDRVNSVEDLFTEMDMYYCFLNYAFLERIIKAYLEHTALRNRLSEYSQLLDNFKNSTTLGEFKDMVLKAHKTSIKVTGSTKEFCKVTVRLTDGWMNSSIKNMEKLMKVIFKDKHSVLTHLQVVSGSVVVVYLAPQSEVQSLIALAKTELRFMSSVGVCEVELGEEVKMFPRDVAFSFEKALIKAIKDNDLRVLTFLLELNTSPNVMDKDEWTGLMIASHAGNTTVVSQLLKAGAKPDLQKGDGTTALIIASQKGHSDIISLLLEAKANPNHKNNTGASALWMASIDGHPEAVDLLLKANAKPDLTNNNGTTALYVASQEGYLNVVNLLLAASADPDVQCGNGSSALFIALYKGHTEIVSLLLANNAKPDLLATNGFTALHFACQMEFHVASKLEQSKIVSLLLERKADPNIQTNFGDTALHLASRNGHTEVVQQLLEANANPSLKNNDGGTALHTASVLGQSEIVGLLLEKDADPNIQMNNGETALHLASQERVVLHWPEENVNISNEAMALQIASVRSGRPIVVSLLLEKNADPNIQMSNGETALYVASEQGCSDIVNLLLKAGANPDIPKNDGRTPLYQASQYGHEEIVNLLLKANAKVDKACYDGTTALYMASQNGHTRIVSLLLSANANPNIQHDSGATALHLASQTGNTDIIRMLLQKATDNSICNIQTTSRVTALHLAVQNHHHAVVSLLLLHGANPNLQATTGVTPLHISSQNGSDGIVDMLLHNNADPNLKVRDDQTALFLASHNGHFRVVKLLLKYNADPNLCCDDGTTPLYVASQQDHAKIVRLLLKYNANPNTATVDGWHTPLMVASYRGYQTITELLLSHGADPNMKDSAGKTALTIAKSFGHETLAHRLLQVTETVAEATTDQPTSPPLSQTVTTLQELQAEELTHKQSLKKSVKEFLGITKNEPKKPVIKKLQTVAVDVIVFIHGK